MPIEQPRAVTFQVLLLEDEPLALAQLEAGVRAFSEQVSIVGGLASVRDTTSWLRSHPAPDLIIADVQLADGISLRAFEEVRTSAPVVVCTAYDDYLEEALGGCGIDYLLKPLEVARLHAALDKYLRLRVHFEGRMEALLHGLAAPAPRARLIARRGADFVPVPASDIAYVFSEHKLPILVDRAGRQHVLDGSLNDVQRALDPNRFFRVNRQLLASLDAVERFRPHLKGRLSVVLRPPPPFEVVVSQENAEAFRSWLSR